MQPPQTTAPIPSTLAFVPQTKRVTWNPLAKQPVEPDTLFLLDPASEAGLTANQNGFIPADGVTPWLGSSSVIEVPGRYRTGLQSVQPSNGFLWMPLAGYLPTDQFTVEMWLKASVPWSQISDNRPFGLVTNGVEGIVVNVNQGRLWVRFAHNQAAGGPLVANVNYNASTVTANRWVNVAFTYDNQVLRLYINGLLADTAYNVTPPQVWSDASYADGLSLGGADGLGATQMAISDVRISRFARTPGLAMTVSNANDLFVNPGSLTGAAVNQDLLGGLHALTAPQTETMAKGVLHVIRTDKMLTATPIKLGSPDATHPSLGVTGVYSYDWQVVDRTFAYLARLGVTPYISIDAAPQILGGKVPPLSGTDLTTDLAYQSAFAPQVPNDLSAWADMVKDFVYHVTVQDGYRAPYWGVWNEPDDSVDFWNGTQSDYLALYETTAQAVKSVNPSLLVGGPEIARWDADASWVKALIDDCAAKNIPLDFVSWHYYSGNLGEIPEARAEVQQWSQAAGIPTPRLVVGEWAWQSANLPGTGAPGPWITTNYFLNDWHAAFVAQSLMEMQANGVTTAIYTRPVAESTDTGWSGTGLMSSTEPWANLNVFRMWSMLEPQIVSSTYAGQPGVMAQASRGSDGRLSLLLAYLRYRKDVDAPVAIHLPASYRGWVVHDYVVDDQHSDAYDAGPGHAGLEQAASSVVAADGTTAVVLRPRSVHLLVISPSS